VFKRVAAWDGTVELDGNELSKPFHWRKPRTVAVCFMGDLFGESVPANYIDLVWRTMHDAHQHRYLLLTKRPERMKRYFGSSPKSVLPNVWPGTTICTQPEADRNVPLLVSTPAAHRWLSLEPLLEQIDLTASGSQGVGEQLIDYINWVVVGCESGPNRRPMPWAWARLVAEQCRDAKVPYYVKQLSANPDGSGPVIRPGDPRWPSDWARQQPPDGKAGQ
jgi:protein gp37